MKLVSAVLLGVGLALAGAGLSTWFWSRAAQHQAELIWQRALTPSSSSQQETRDPRAASLVLLSCPRLSQRVFVLPRTDQLDQGPALMEATAQPGQNGNCVIAGHRDTHFQFLKDVRPGDDLFLERSGARYRYRVSSTHIVNPTNMTLLRPESAAVLTLVTCYPFHYVGTAPQRFIVRAELLNPSAG